MDEIEVQRLAIAINALRPDWPIKSLQTIIAAQAPRAWGDLAVALTAVAVDPRSRSPKRVTEHGPWWAAAQVANGSGEQPPPAPPPIGEVLAEVRQLGVAPEARLRYIAAARHALRRSAR